jgi:hypothetical protein
MSHDLMKMLQAGPLMSYQGYVSIETNSWRFSGNAQYKVAEGVYIRRDSSHIQENE